MEILCIFWKLVADLKQKVINTKTTNDHGRFWHNKLLKYSIFNYFLINLMQKVLSQVKTYHQGILLSTTVTGQYMVI